VILNGNDIGIWKMKIRDTVGNGVHVEGSTKVWIEKCLIEDIGEFGIRLAGRIGFAAEEVIDSIVEKNKITAPQSEGIVVQGDRNVLEKNIKRNWSRLIRKVYETECPRCEQPMRVVASTWPLYISPATGSEIGLYAAINNPIGTDRRILTVGI